MRCDRCEAEMFQTRLTGMPTEVILTNKKRGIFESEKRSRVLCFVCPECGRVELMAEDPKGLRIE